MSSGTRTVDRAVTLLSLVCEQGPIALADVAREAELSPSTALRLLRSLQQVEFVIRDEAGDFRPGPRTFALGALALNQDSLLTRLRPLLRELAEETGESMYLAVTGPNQTALYVEIVEGTHSVRHASWVGRTVPLADSAVGQALTEAVAKDGYALRVGGVETDVTAVAVPVRIGGRTVAAINAVVPSYRLTKTQAQRLGRIMVQAVQQVEG